LPFALVLIFSTHQVHGDQECWNSNPSTLRTISSPLRLSATGQLRSWIWIEVKRLVTDKTYQREISRAGSINVERIAEYFEWAKFSPVIVAPVKGGMFSIIDGQHRATAAMLRGIEKVPCDREGSRG
jgi:hypothetical protein